MERRWSKWSCISIHSLRMEGDLSQLKYIYSLSVFQSTPSAWRETVTVVPPSPSTRVQSTPSAWRETFCLFHCNSSKFISIHSLRMEGDRRFPWYPVLFLISIHSLRMEGDCLHLLQVCRKWKEFQSTPSAWRETQSDRPYDGCRVYFNPLPPHGGRRGCPHRAVRSVAISIHSLRMEGDSIPSIASNARFISIHSLRMEGDNFDESNRTVTEHFNPLPPHGGRRAVDRGGSNRIYFNPLPPHGGRPISVDIYSMCPYISIHSLRMEGDAAGTVFVRWTDTFQSTPSAWRETASLRSRRFAFEISIHSLRMEGDA